MSSAGEERSLASGIPIPQWMRNKTENYGFDPSALSPPQHEGDFFYIKFPKHQQNESSNMKTLSTVIEGQEQQQPFLRRSESYKQFATNLQESVNNVQAPKIIRPMIIENGFQASEGTSGTVVEVANQMLGIKNNPYKPFTRGETEGSLPPPSLYPRQRRDSKSLPASPLASPESSPRTLRKNYSRLFGGTLFSTDNLNKIESDEETEKKSNSSWILSSLFAAKENGKETAGDKSLVSVDPDSKKVATRKASTSDNPKQTMSSEISSLPPKTTKTTFLKSKPHLRDLNLLSPTSM